MNSLHTFWYQRNNVGELTVPRSSVFKTGESRRIFFLTDAPLNPTTKNLFLLAAQVRTHDTANVGSRGQAVQAGAERVAA